MTSTTAPAIVTYASVRQISFIESLAAERGPAAAELVAAANIQEGVPGGRQGRASKLIDTLKTLPRVATQPSLPDLHAPAAGEFTPTPEQVRAVDMFLAGESFKVYAFAGAGKTSTLKLMAQAMPERTGYFLAFNKGIVVDAGATMPGNVECKTAHGLAYGSTPQAFRNRLKSYRMKGQQLANALDIDPLNITVTIEDKPREKRLAPGFLASKVMAAVDRFCQSADREVATKHFSRIDGLDEPGSWENHDRVARHLLPAAKDAWADIMDPSGKLPYSHSHYLKRFELSGPRLHKDFIMVDEAQDLSPVLLSIVEQQAKYGTQIVLVGDTYQAINCQPVGTMVRVPARTSGGHGSGKYGARYTYDEVPIEDLSVGDRVVSYDIPGYRMRMGGSPVSEINRQRYIGDLVTIKTEDGTVSRYTPDHHCVAKIGDAFPALVVYLMRKGNQYRIGKTEWRRGKGSNINGPVTRARAEKADAVWVLSAHDTNESALLAEAIAAHQFNIPTWCFEPGATHRTSITDFWIAVGDNTAAATQCLLAHGRRIDSPIWQAGDHAWFTKRPVVTRACNLMTGMRVLPADALSYDQHHRQWNAWDKSWVTATVTSEPYDGEIVSMTVDTDHTYIGDGIVTHNSFTGAVDALDNAAIETSTVLTKSFRFGPAIATCANFILQTLGATETIEGNETVDSTVGETPDAVCHLYRTNAGAVRHFLTELDRGGKPHLVGGGKQIEDFCKAALELQTNGFTPHPELACFDSWTEVQQYVDTEEQGADLKLMVRLIDEFTAERIIAALQHMPAEKAATLIVSTAHKVKGREWITVRLGGDFPKGVDKDGIPVDLDPEEAQLLYVAITRAKIRVDFTQVGALAFIIPAPAVPAEADEEEKDEDE